MNALAMIETCVARQPQEAAYGPMPETTFEPVPEGRNAEGYVPPADTGVPGAVAW